jgi:AcrR family transcriptional regulator
MTTQARKQRERATREQLFLDTAERMIREEGLLNLQMSRLAEACDYATGTLYQHFASKEDLLLALATGHLRRRAAAFPAIPDLPLPTRDRMLAAIMADIDFAEREPEYWRLSQYISTEVIWNSASAARRQELLAEGEPIAAALGRIITQAVAAGDLPPRAALRPVELAAGPWCLNIGMHTLVHAHGLLEAYAVRAPYDLLLVHAQALLNGLGWVPLTDLSDTSGLAATRARIERLLAAAGTPA